MKKLLLFCFNLLLFSNLINAQGKLDYDHDSKWFWGFNYGGTWSTADINYKLHNGWGITLGKSFNYNYGKVFSFDIRGRYLRGTWFGQNADTSHFASNYSGIFNQSGMNYKDSLGFTIYNHKTATNRLALELVIHANRIREKTGWDPYIFGGIGLTWYETKSNIIDGNSFDLNPIYQYDSTINYNVSSLKALHDNEYETSVSSFKPAFMPSLGFGLGYQIGKRVSIGIEHKTTFTMKDEWDGLIKNSQYKQDLYHYSGGYIRFQIRGGEREERTQHTHTPDPVTTNPNPINPTPENRQLPIVTYTNPSTSGTVVNSPNYTIRAEIKYIDSRNNISFKQDGQINNNFSFSNGTQLTSNVILHEGNNVFVTTGTNQYGTDTEETIIIYKKQTGIPPIVTILNPKSNPERVSNQTFNFKGTVLNVNNASQVSMTFNGQNFTSFTFNPTNKEVIATLNLREGSNVVVLNGTNEFGADSKTGNIIFEKLATLPPPVVTITNPSSSPYTVKDKNFNLEGTVLNVSTNAQIKVVVNGKNTNNFTFDASIHKVNVPLTLNSGTNTILIKGTNTVGSDEKTTTIILRESAVILPPVVKFINPSSNPYSSTVGTYGVLATVLNVSDKSAIQVILNGSSLTNFNFNISNKEVSFNVNLIEGNNLIKITGTNTAGTDSKEQTILYKKPAAMLPPFVKFINPSAPGTVVNNSSYLVKATVENVTTISGIQVERNGSILNTNEFTFNTSTKEVSFNNTLISGLNNFKITGTNSAGSHNATTSIKYETINVPCKNPKISWITPMTNNMEYKEDILNVKAKVVGITNGNQVKLFINGIEQSNINLNDGNISLVGKLMEKANSIDIIAKNDCGEVKDSRTVIYKKEVPCDLPTLILVRPEKNLNTSTNKINIYATVKNVISKEQISVKLNGVEQIFNFDPTNKAISAIISSLKVNQNKIEIKLLNECGSASDFWNITYSPCDTPTISKISSNINDKETTNLEAFELILGTSFISSQNQITCTRNGANVNFIFTPNNNQIKISTALLKGENNFLIRVNNNCGEKSLTYLINKMDEKNPPKITITSPLKCGIKINDNKVNYKGFITNVTSSDSILISVNGVTIKNYTPVFANGKMTFDFVKEREGETVNYNIYVFVKNKDGQDAKSCTVILELPGGNTSPSGKTGTVSKPGSIVPTEKGNTTSPKPNEGGTIKPPSGRGRN